MQPEVVVERWLDLNIGSNKTKRTIGGQIQVRFVRTLQPVRQSRFLQLPLKNLFTFRISNDYLHVDPSFFGAQGRH